MFIESLEPRALFAVQTGEYGLHVLRTVTGYVADADGNRLEGVAIDSPLDGITNAGRQSDPDVMSSKPNAELNGDFRIASLSVGQNVFDRKTRRFLRFEPFNVRITAQTQDLAGKRFTHTENFGEIFHSAGKAPRSAKGSPVVELNRVLKLDGYGVVDSNGTIRLHRGHELKQTDTASASRLDRLRATGRRWAAEVRAVLEKLSRLGFQQTPSPGGTPLALSDTLNGPPAAPQDISDSAGARAIRLFKAVLAAANKNKTTSFYEQAPVLKAATLQALNSVPSGAVFWNRWRGSAAVREYSDQIEPNPYFNNGVLRLIGSIEAEAQTIAPGRTIWLFSGSNAVGGRFNEAGAIGTGHTSGSQVDFGLPAVAGNAPSATWQAANYDRGATKRLIAALIRSGATVIRFNDPVLLADQNLTDLKQQHGALFTSWVGHNDHVHATAPFSV